MNNSTIASIEFTLPKAWEQPESFQDNLTQWLERAPWFAISMTLHLMIYFVLAAIPWRALNEEPAIRLQAEIAPRIEELIELPETVVIEDRDPLPVEDPKLMEVDLPLDPSAADPSLDFPAASDPAICGDLSIATPSALGLGPMGNLSGRGLDKGKLTAGTGGAGTQAALRAALEWLAHHQSPNGSWSAEGFGEHCGALGAGRCTGPGNPAHDVGITGLALLAFLGNGDTPFKGDYRRVVQRAVSFLKSEQDYDSGLIGNDSSRDFIYDHAIASLALAESFYLTKSPLLKKPAQRAINYISRARNPYAAWRYGAPPEGDNDTSVSGWMLFALKSARDAGLQVDPEAFGDGLAWLDQVTTSASGHVGYDARGRASSRTPSNESFPREKGEAMTAVGLLCRIFLGQDPHETRLDGEQVLLRAADLLLTKLPEWDEQGFGCDMYYWYYGTYAMFQMGGKYWQRWNATMKETLLKNQVQTGDAKGSWNPVGPWGHSGGRIYSTALMALCLEVYFRYGNLLGER